MEPSDTSVLRKLAPDWSLAGDKHLLQVLEQMHQKIISKCQEVNTKLDEMVNTLDNASMDMQNVNNKFMALSNSQFIESRVYDDDMSDVDNEKQTVPPVEQESEVSKIKRSLQTLEDMHETVRILDSDSSDEDDDLRTILKPKDMYTGRPLPYIIDSQPWRTKWHVGLVPSDSESDSSTEFFKNEVPREQYSESESEDEPNQQTGRDVSMISSNSEVESEPSPAARPADIAAQIAKRLTAHRPVPLEPEPREEPAPETVPRKVYRAEPLVPATVFSDEPPPLEESDGDYSDDDIFAELHKKASTSKQQTRPRGFESRNVVDDLFGDQLFEDERNIEEIRPAEKVMTGAKDNPTLYEDNLDSNLFTQREVVKPTSQVATTVQSAKKPIGGMSLFGSSKGAESIGAAILKRNQRKSSSSEEDSNEREEHKQSVINKRTGSPDATTKIIEDLFSKSKSNNKDTKITKVDDKLQEKEKPMKAKIDLFSDNIFDDIDDIFTTEIVVKPKESLKQTKRPQKSIFDEDELFADIPIKTSVNNKNKDSLFDSDDELFKEDNLNVDGNKNNNFKADISKTVVTKENEPCRETSKHDGNRDIFNVNNLPILQNTIDVNARVSPSCSNTDDLNDPLVRSDTLKDSNNYTGKESNIKNTIHESKALSEPTLSNTSVRSKQFESPLLFGEDEIDDLFIKNSKQFESGEDRTKDFTGENTKKDIFNSSSKNGGVEKESKTQNNKFIKHQEQEANNNDLRVQNVDDKETINSQVADEQFSLKKHEEAEIKSVSAETTVLKHSARENSNFNNAHVFNDIKNSKIMGTVPSAVVKQVNNQNETLDDIFSDLPPAFEKPSEPKKSKNVNALFDDDSDDEALFFKKNDINEEKPEVTYKDDRFRIFHDEPPDIDVDFSRKSKDNIGNNVESDDDLFNVPEPLVKNELISEETTTTTTTPYNHDTKKKESNADISEDRKALAEIQKSQTYKIHEDTTLNISKLLESVNIETDNNKLECKTVETKDDYKSNITPENDILDRETNGKKFIGKLKPMNISINVNSLLPGASPVKQKPKDESDGLVFSTKSNEELNKYTTQKEESKMVKSVSFDGDPESSVLDNQLSKGRAKIQVKRRPSSRRARLEAVRKSGIEFGDDSTDNSGSFDEPGPKIDTVFDITSETTSTDSINHYNKEEETQGKRQIIIVRSDDNKSTDKKLETVQNIENTKTKSKTVYILHDEDIFADSPVTDTGTSKKTLTILDDDDELFNNPISKSVKNDEVLNTQNPLDNKTSALKILDDVDELFKNPISKPTKNDVGSNTQKSLEDKTEILKVLDADDLFKHPISKSVKYDVDSNMQKLKDKVNPNNGAKENAAAKSKKSIFDDLSDDDDELFGGKKSSGMTSNDDTIFKKSKTDNTKVLDKPKSLFGDDSDDDLFKGGKSSDVKPRKTKETISTVSKPVINDPLSLFDDS